MTIYFMKDLFFQKIYTLSHLSGTDFRSCFTDFPHFPKFPAVIWSTALFTFMVVYHASMICIMHLYITELSIFLAPPPLSIRKNLSAPPQNCPPFLDPKEFWAPFWTPKKSGCPYIYPFPFNPVLYICICQLNKNMQSVTSRLMFTGQGLIFSQGLEMHIYEMCR